MTVVIAASTDGKFTTFSSTHATLATCLSDVLNELETHNKSKTQTDFVNWFDDTGQEFTLVAICRN